MQASSAWNWTHNLTTQHETYHTTYKKNIMGGGRKVRALHAKACEANTAKQINEGNQQCDEFTSQQPSPEPYHKQILKRDHADDESFNAKSFPFDELYPKWKGDEFDPHFMNAATGRKFNNMHHTKGEGLKTRKNFERFDFAFCLEWKYRTVKGITFRDRCYNEFSLKSQGCCDHPKAVFKEGPNMVFYCMMRGESCTWEMLKDHQATVSDEGTKFWTYVDWKLHAEDLAKKVYDIAAEQGREDCEEIVAMHMAEFETWWRVEGKKDEQQGGAQAATARGYSLMGTLTHPPAFMSRQTDSTFPITTGLSGLNLNASRPANSRRTLIQGTSQGRQGLNTKQKAKQQAKIKKFVKSEEDNNSFFSSFKKERKPRHGNTGQGNTNQGGQNIGAA